jgi:hypothetical protein
LTSLTPQRKCLPPSPEPLNPNDDDDDTCVTCPQLCPRRDGTPPTRDRLLHDFGAMRAKDVVSELAMGMEESQNERDARVETLWRKLDSQNKGELDWKALQHGLKKIDHRRLPLRFWSWRAEVVDAVPQLSRMPTTCSRMSSRWLTEMETARSSTKVGMAP